MKKLLSIIPLVAVLAWSAACQTQKVPAENAMKAAETAWAAVSAEAMKYVPDQAKGIDETIRKAKAALANGQYEAVIKDTTGLPAKIADLQKVIADKKSEWTAAWKTLESSLGSGLTAVQAKVDELSAAKKLPKGVEKAAVETAKTSLATAQQAFADAKTAFGNADYEGALAKGNQVKAALATIATDLKLEMPVAAESGKALVESATETIKDVLGKK
jgi:hypothetical protein